MTKKRHIILQLILASVSQALAGSSNSTEYDCAHSVRCYESSSNEASSTVLIGIITVALMGTLCVILLSLFMPGECTNVRRGEGLNNSKKMLILLSTKEITKNARTIYHASIKNSCIFSRIPYELLAKIAGLTGYHKVHKEMASNKIALRAISTDIEAGNKPPTRYLNV